ncbi:MAG TPA: carbon monoxide dehydrogenase, partial [Thermodesulfobacteriota bacterium]|nr:carbon monoxide dehydrogenase [Thermodesulfobacteriota bacterium]
MMADETKKLKEEKVKSLLTVCEASQEMIDKAKVDGVSLVFDRAEAMKPCPIGAEGSCCKNCAMGPCRLPAPKKKAEGEEKKRVGVCGATIETIAA